MKETSPAKLSVLLALEALSEASEEVRRRADATEEARALRNRLIIEARRGEISVNRLAKLTGLSREAINKIIATAGEAR